MSTNELRTHGDLIKTRQSDHPAELVAHIPRRVHDARATGCRTPAPHEKLQHDQPFRAPWMFEAAARGEAGGVASVAKGLRVGWGWGDLNRGPVTTVAEGGVATQLSGPVAD